MLSVLGRGEEIVFLPVSLIIDRACRIIFTLNYGNQLETRALRYRITFERKNSVYLRVERGEPAQKFPFLREHVQKHVRR